MVWDKSLPAGTDRIRDSDDYIRANWTEVELRRLENLIDNATFGSRSAGTTSVPDEWSLEGTPTVAYDTVDTGYGDYAVKLTAVGAANEGINITLKNLKVSTKYQVFARVKVTAGDTATLVTTGATTNIDADSTSETWEDITGEFVTDASATDVVMKLVASADGDIVWFCGITCVEGDIPPANFIRRRSMGAIGWCFDGDVYTGTKFASIVLPWTIKILKVKIYADTAPVGADLIVDVNLNGTTIFTTQGNRPTIADGANADDSATPDVTTATAGDRLSYDIDQVGSSTAGGNHLSITLWYYRA